MSINLFGSPQIKRGDEHISVQRRKDLALLIYLVSSSQPQSRDTLATLLWPDQPQTDARANLRKSLSRLKSKLGEKTFIISQNQISLNLTLPIHLDTAQFYRYIDQFRQHSHIKRDRPSHCTECQSLLEKAVRLYCADFLQGFSLPDSSAFEEWQFFQSESLRKNLAEALEQLTLQLTAAGNSSKAIEYGRRWLSLDPLHEPAHRQLMLLYALTGQQSAALRQFEECSRFLQKELNAEPEAETLRLNEAILKKKLEEIIAAGEQQHVAGSMQAASPPSSTEGASPRLPVHPGAFIGREKELEEIFKILNDPSCQLLTLMGPGGSGKTRLALQVAAVAGTRTQALMKDGVRFILLAPITDPNSLVDAFIEALKIGGPVQRTERRQNLLGHLQGRQMLLVVDNFEHLISSESIQLLSDLLNVAPLSKVLVTSRERLNIRGEYLYRVQGLDTPDENSLPAGASPESVLRAFSALQLFQHSAGRIQPSFQITPENYAPIAQICRTVQGMPLAIELAASWLEVFSPDEINREIQRSLDFLQSSWRDIPDRQRSLRAVFDSSWELLDKQTRPIVKALSIFRSSFTREAAQAVSGASAKVLLDLTNKSWIQRLANGRYQIHELLKQFLYEKLSRDKSTLEQVREQYCRHYANYAHSLWDAMKGVDQKRAYTSIEAEFENFQTAWTWLISQNRSEIAVQRMLPVLFHYTEIRGKTIELLNMLDLAIRAQDGSGKGRNPRQMEIILQTANSAFFQDGYPLRYSIHDAIFPIDLEKLHNVWRQAKQPVELHELGFWGILLAYVYGRLINLKEGVRQIRKMIPYFQHESQTWELANAYLHLLKLIVPNRDQPDEQVELLSSYLSQATDLFDRMDDRINRGHILMLAGDLKFMQRNMKGAIEQWKAARAMYASVDEWGTATNVIWWLIDAYLQVGDFQKVYEYCAEMADIYLQHGLRNFAIGVISKESLEKSRHGDLADALRLRQRCIDMIHETGPEYQFAWNYWEMGELVRLSGDLSGAADWFERSFKIFERGPDHVGRSFYYRGMGDIAMLQGNFRAAHRFFMESVRHSRASNHIWMIAYSVNALGRSELALKHHSAAQKHIFEGLRMALKSADQGIMLVVLAAYATLLYDEGDKESAARLASLVANHFLTWHETRKQVEDLLSLLQKSLPSKTFLQAQKQGRTLDLWETMRALVRSRQTN